MTRIILNTAASALQLNKVAYTFARTRPLDYLLSRIVKAVVEEEVPTHPKVIDELASSDLLLSYSEITDNAHRNNMINAIAQLVRDISIDMITLSARRPDINLSTAQYHSTLVGHDLVVICMPQTSIAPSHSDLETAHENTHTGGGGT